MEEIYFYKSKDEKEIKKILNLDEFMRLSFTERITSYNNESGFFILISGDKSTLDSLELVFKHNEIKIEKLETFIKSATLSKFKDTEENAACGMGLIFG